MLTCIKWGDPVTKAKFNILPADLKCSGLQMRFTNVKSQRKLDPNLNMQSGIGNEMTSSTHGSPFYGLKGEEIKKNHRVTETVKGHRHG